MRSEEFDRIRRRLSIAFFKLDPSDRLLHFFQPTDPWNTIYPDAHPDASHSSDRFWQVEIKDKCNAFLTQVRTWAQVMDDGASYRQSPGYMTNVPGPKRQRVIGRQRNQGSWYSDTTRPSQSWSPDVPRTAPDADRYLNEDKSGFEICRNYNAERQRWQAKRKKQEGKGQRQREDGSVMPGPPREHPATPTQHIGPPHRKQPQTESSTQGLTPIFRAVQQS